MIQRLSETLLIKPEDVAPTQDDLEVIGTFNPGAVTMGKTTVLMVRVAERPRERRPGYTALPRWDCQKGLLVDWVPNDAVEQLDPRVVRHRADGLVRLTFVSHLRVMFSPDPHTIEEHPTGRFLPQTVWEEFGVEDPRITRIGDTFYFTYVAVSRHGAATALASTCNFQTYSRHGIIFCPENKDVLLFPEQVGGNYLALHRPNGATPFTRPEMWLARSTDLVRWGTHEPLLSGHSDWETDRVGGGTPPIRTPVGWLEIYHGSQQPRRPGGVGIYSAGALLLDAENPSRIIKRSTETVLEPEAEFEQRGFVPGVVFPTGLVTAGDRYRIYYGAADTFTGMVELSREEVLASLA